MKPESPKASATQVGGNHYKDMVIQPAEFIHKNGIGYMEGCAIKYLSRWKKKNGRQDLLKARHYIDLLLEMTPDPESSGVEQASDSGNPESGIVDAAADVIKSVVEAAYASHPSDTTRCVKCGFYFSFPSNETPPSVCPSCQFALNR